MKDLKNLIMMFVMAMFGCIIGISLNIQFNESSTKWLKSENATSDSLTVLVKYRHDTILQISIEKNHHTKGKGYLITKEYLFIGDFENKWHK